MNLSHTLSLARLDQCFRKISNASKKLYPVSPAINHEDRTQKLDDLPIESIGDIDREATECNENTVEICFEHINNNIKDNHSLVVSYSRY